MSWLTFIILVGVTWRVTRFLVDDDLIGGTRDRLKEWLDRPRVGWRNTLAEKGWFLVTCPWCVGVYVSAGVLLGARLFALHSIPMPVYTWLAVAGFAMVPYNYLDGK